MSIKGRVVNFLFLENFLYIFWDKNMIQKYKFKLDLLKKLHTS